MKNYKESEMYKNALKLSGLAGLSFVFWCLWYYYACAYFEIKKPSYPVVFTIVITLNYLVNKIKSIVHK